MKELYYLIKVKIYKDPEAFSWIYDKYVDRIYKFVLLKVNNVQDAQDITSEVFLKAWQYLVYKDKKVGNIKSFLYIISRNTVADFYRQQKIQKIPLQQTDEKLLKNKEKTSNIEIQANNKLQLEQVRKALINLKDDYRDVIILKYINQLSINEISEIIGKNNTATRVLLHRAIQKLKKSVENYNSY